MDNIFTCNLKKRTIDSPNWLLCVFPSFFSLTSTHSEWNNSSSSSYSVCKWNSLFLQTPMNVYTLVTHTHWHDVVRHTMHNHTVQIPKYDWIEFVVSARRVFFCNGEKRDIDCGEHFHIKAEDFRSRNAFSSSFCLTVSFVLEILF